MKNKNNTYLGVQSKRKCKGSHLGGGWWECTKKTRCRQRNKTAIFQQNNGSQNTKEDIFKVPKGKTVNLELYIKEKYSPKKKAE